MNTVDKLNAAIREFVQRPENSVLRSATGAYSTPFRGSLFGRDKADEVERELAKRGASVLLLGSNPNCPGSLGHIMAGATDDGHWPEFIEQINSGYFGECVRGRNGSARAWDPIHNSSSMNIGQKTSWTFYADAIRAGAGSLDGVAFANVFPWGSGKLDCLLRHIREIRTHDSTLLDRAVEFANHQLETMVRSLRPGLILCPNSVSNHRLLRGLLLSQERCDGVTNISPTGLEGSRFRMRLGKISFDSRTQPVLFVNHPSALRFNRKSDRPKIHCALSQAIARGLGMAIPAAA